MKSDINRPTLSGWTNEQLMIEMVERSLQNLSDPQIREHINDHPPRWVRHQFSNIKMSFARCFGHTATAVTLLNKYPSSLLFVYDERDRDYVSKGVFTNIVGASVPCQISASDDRVIKAEVNRTMYRVLSARDDQLREKVYNRPKPELVILDRASEFTSLEKEGIISLYPDAKLIIELQ